MAHMKWRSGRGVGFLLVVLLVSASACQYISDRIQDCRQVSVDLVNRPPGGPAIHLTVDDERASAANLVEGSGFRRVNLCLARGDRAWFRAVRPDGEVVGVVACVLSLDPFQYEAERARVVWEPRGFICERF